MVRMDVGRAMLSRFLHRKNVEFSMVVMPFPRVTWVRARLDSKAEEPMVVTRSGMIKVLILDSKKAFGAMSVTVAGKANESRFFSRGQRIRRV